MSESFQLFDTLSREKRPLFAEDGQTFRFYCCGPTVYGPAHIGNFRTYVLQDVFRRTLEAAGLKTYHVRNITDVDDKTIRESRARGESLSAFTQRWTDRFHRDGERLNLLPPHVEPTATGHIPEQITLTETLLAKGNAYIGGDGSVYFRTASFPEYGKLAHLDLESLQTQNTNSGEQANLADEYDRDSVADFALWKKHKAEDGDNAWESPWGAGRPGWHLECSAMSMKYLGESFDLHSGGVDLIFPHHENEIAQSESATGKPFARHWFHPAHLMVEGKKMSKSLGNLYTVEDIEQRGFHPIVLRYLLLSGSYRQQFNFTEAGLHAAASALRKLDKAVAQLLEKAGQAIPNAPLAPESFVGDLTAANSHWLKDAWQALFDDLNTPAALGAFFKALAHPPEGDPAQLLAEVALFSSTLGLHWFVQVREEAVATEAPAEIRDMAEARWEAKKARDFQKADSLRQALAAAGWVVVDSKDGYELTPQS